MCNSLLGSFERCDSSHAHAPPRLLETYQLQAPEASSSARHIVVAVGALRPKEHTMAPPRGYGHAHGVNMAVRRCGVHWNCYWQRCCATLRSFDATVTPSPCNTAELPPAV